MATEVADDTELTPATGPFSGRMSNIAMAIGGAGLVAFLAAGGLFVASYNGSHKTAPQQSAPSVVASAPAPAPEPPAAPAPGPASTMFSTPPVPAHNSTTALASKTAGTMPDFSLPTIDWPTFDPPSTGWPTVDWQAVLTAPAQAQNANSAANIFSAIIGAASGTVGWIGNGTATVVGDLLLASAYNGGNGGTDSLATLLSGMGASPQVPDLMAALQTLPPPPDLTKLPSLTLPPPPDLTKLAPLALALPPPPDLTKLPPLALPPPPDLTGLLFALPPPPSIGLPSLHLWPFF
ncbi:MAG: hypothetical protein ABWY93_23120 [Mycobacterium sp.]